MVFTSLLSHPVGRARARSRLGRPRREFGTTYHLHFDTQVLTKYGWTFVNPYMTLVTAYERLLSARPGNQGGSRTEYGGCGARGAVTQGQAPLGVPLDIGQAHASLSGGDDDHRVGQDKSGGINGRLKIASLPKSEIISSGRSDGDARERSSARAKHGVRALGHHISAKSHRARRAGSDLHARHERDKIRHSRLRASR